MTFACTSWGAMKTSPLDIHSIVNPSLSDCSRKRASRAESFCLLTNSKYCPVILRSARSTQVWCFHSSFKTSGFMTWSSEIRRGAASWPHKWSSSIVLLGADSSPIRAMVSGKLSQGPSAKTRPQAINSMTKVELWFYSSLLAQLQYPAGILSSWKKYYHIPHSMRTINVEK